MKATELLVLLWRDLFVVQSHSGRPAGRIDNRAGWLHWRISSRRKWMFEHTALADSQRAKTPSEQTLRCSSKYSPVASKIMGVGSYVHRKETIYIWNYKTSQKLEPCIWMKNVSTYDACCKQISAHEPNHRFECDDTPRVSTHHEHGGIFDIFQHKLRTRRHIYSLKVSIVHSSNKEIDTEYWDT